DLALLIGRSPRAAKRFVNTYRVIRASLAESQRHTFEQERGYEALLFLLALNTGAPSLLPLFVDRLAQSTDPLTPPVQLLAKVAEDTLSAPSAPSAREAARRVRQWALHAEARWTSLTPDQLIKRFARVRQFSFAGDTEAQA
ncbi:MAG TPA: hypothetical protein VIO38_09310, partial [Rariglobus sp.]